MITPNELRLGNYVTFTNSDGTEQLATVTLLGQPDNPTLGRGTTIVTASGEDYYRQYDELEPVLLSTEMLELSGFQHYSDNVWLLTIHTDTTVKEYYARAINDQSFALFAHQRLSNESFLRNVIHLHTLQNIIFDLAKTELQVKGPAKEAY